MRFTYGLWIRGLCTGTQYKTRCAGQIGQVFPGFRMISVSKSRLARHSSQEPLLQRGNQGGTRVCRIALKVQGLRSGMLAAVALGCLGGLGRCDARCPAGERRDNPERDERSDGGTVDGSKCSRNDGGNRAPSALDRGNFLPGWTGARTRTWRCARRVWRRIEGR